MSTHLKLAAAVALATGFALAVPAHAQFAKPEDAVKYRKAVMFIQGQTLPRLGAMAQGKTPYDQAQAIANAETLVFTSRLFPAAFGAGTDKGDTRALPVIWTDTAKFKRYQDDLGAATAKLLNAAKAGGGADALKGPFGEVAQTCKGCHDDFRKD
ncbi:MAG: cytochrome c [Burkholderiales bacterium]|jgi:cytochrome c556|nr:cytochrome c [Burkholderiales bacterium]